MTNTQKYKLTLSILFSTEQDLETAITTFNSWCKTQTGTGKQYGFVRTGQILGNLFLISSELKNTWTLHSLITALELNGQVSVIETTSTQTTSAHHPAS